MRLERKEQECDNLKKKLDQYEKNGNQKEYQLHPVQQYNSAHINTPSAPGFNFIQGNSNVKNEVTNNLDIIKNNNSNSQTLSSLNSNSSTIKNSNNLNSIINKSEENKITNEENNLSNSSNSTSENKHGLTSQKSSALVN